jgi:hypothetical protein
MRRRWQIHESVDRRTFRQPEAVTIQPERQPPARPEHESIAPTQVNRFGYDILSLNQMVKSCLRRITFVFVVFLDRAGPEAGAPIA